MVQQTRNGRSSNTVESMWCVLALAARFNGSLPSCARRCPSIRSNFAEPTSTLPYYPTCLHGSLLHIHCCQQHGAIYRAKLCCFVCGTLTAPLPTVWLGHSVLTNTAQGPIAKTRRKIHMPASDQRVSILFPLTSRPFSFTETQLWSLMSVIALHVEVNTARNEIQTSLL